MVGDFNTLTGNHEGNRVVDMIGHCSFHLIIYDPTRGNNAPELTSDLISFFKVSEQFGNINHQMISSTLDFFFILDEMT